MKDDKLISGVILLILLLISSLMIVTVKINENRKMETQYNEIETQYNELITENEILNETIKSKDLRIDQLERTLKSFAEDERVNEKLLFLIMEYSDTNIEDFEMWLYLNHKEWYLENFYK